MKVELYVVDCETGSNRIVLSLPAILGRGNDADLIINHPEVSRRHCRIFAFQNVVHIQDLNSLNGTLVSGNRIQNTETTIHPEETFSVGPVLFRISYHRQMTAYSDISGSTSRKTRGSISNAQNLSKASASKASVSKASASKASASRASSGNQTSSISRQQAITPSSIRLRTRK
ncbi:MAG: FHA domain-containing protein [Thermoguttaceae bacterium]|nr:FHA domain-containing protein [Planctomycetaceae bacterium]MBQ4142342.1 FHA domain-containing protein [Thermoguttaceae bacterium]